MPKLRNNSHEAFARMLAKDLPIGAAYESAGYRSDAGHPSRLAAREDIKARVEEHRRLQAETRLAAPQTIIPALLAIAETSLALGDAAGCREARLALMDARRVDVERSMEDATERAREAEAAERIGLAVRKAVREALSPTVRILE